MEPHPTRPADKLHLFAAATVRDHATEQADVGARSEVPFSADAWSQARAPPANQRSNIGRTALHTNSTMMPVGGTT